jgi:hypothetical protein
VLIRYGSSMSPVHACVALSRLSALMKAAEGGGAEVDANRRGSSISSDSLNRSSDGGSSSYDSRSVSSAGGSSSGRGGDGRAGREDQRAAGPQKQIDSLRSYSRGEQPASSARGTGGHVAGGAGQYWHHTHLLDPSPATFLREFKLLLAPS